MRDMVIEQTKYHSRMAATSEDLRAAQVLRHRAFHGQVIGPDLDRDAFDDRCSHILVEEASTGRLVSCFRMLHLTHGSEIERTYSAQFYELSALHQFDAPMVEMGRFCIDPACHDVDVLRVAWAAMTRYVDDHGVEMLFGCSSFKGTDANPYFDAFAMLKERHLAPRRWGPRVKAPAVFRFAERLRRRKPDAKQAIAGMPPLLRTYLMMGGWVSDHAVVDPQMNTLHVFTGLEIAATPPMRKRLLRADAN
ncbi:MAG: GNAT family N-acyltransferase [Pseudomonadota bacterium]